MEEWDPLLASATLTGMIGCQLLLLLAWEQVKESIGKPILAVLMIVGEWFYLFGEVLSNTITIGEPPRDIGSLFEMAAGVLYLVALGLFLVLYLRHQSLRFPIIQFSVFVLVLFLLLWWFTHPIDQSKAGTPSCVPGNILYNFFHQNC